MSYNRLKKLALLSWSMMSTMQTSDNISFHISSLERPVGEFSQLENCALFNSMTTIIVRLMEGYSHLTFKNV